MDRRRLIMAGLILLDATILSNFALVRRSDLVLRLWADRACTTPATHGEYQAAVDIRLMPAEAWANLPIVTLCDAEVVFAAELSSRLGAGERSCLAVASHRQGLLASDDRDARRTAHHHKIPVTGTLGILVLCVQQGHLSKEEANALLEKMIAAGYRSPVGDLVSLLKR
jgi:predicted nucleic acid-binding protein